ncbi:MAG TPA: ATP-binding cassette domain-containing protein [Cyclobacteriaceae bacterium]|nr:ATP-binding cassette domain-containing protein [Cyclobacteriaceae bacterium]
MKISVENLGKRFNREWIFKKLTYDFVPGVYAVTGPNGSGKSTLLQTLWGQMPQSTGTIQYESAGRDVPVEDVFKQIAIATPYMELIEEFTLMEMIRFHFKFKKAKENKTAEELMDSMELSHARDKFISNFSSGMRQRLKLALAFYSEADALFLDEPTTNLDQKATAWYLKNLALVPPDCLIFIASNLEQDYPASAKKIDILSYK